jgi:hypothetical protein
MSISDHAAHSLSLAALGRGPFWKMVDLKRRTAPGHSLPAVPAAGETLQEEPVCGIIQSWLVVTPDLRKSHE